MDTKLKTISVCNATSGHWILSAIKNNFKIVKAYEIYEKQFTETIKLNFPNIDFTNDFDKFIISKADIVCGSPPCIGLSAGNALNQNELHPANINILKFAIAVNKINPKIFVMEMVTNFLKSSFLLNKYLQILKNYKIKIYIINCINYANCQNRKRVLIYGINKSSKIEHKDIAPKRDKNINININFAYNFLKNNKHINKNENLNDYIIPQNTAGCWGHLKTEQSQLTRTIKPNKPCHTITGFAIKDIIHPNKKRFITLAETRVFMGIPVSYKYPKINKLKICKLIASGVPIGTLNRIFEGVK